MTSTDDETIDEVIKEDWYLNYDNVILLTAWMAHDGREAEQVAYAVEKPWKHEDAFKEALAWEREKD